MAAAAPSRILWPFVRFHGEVGAAAVIDPDALRVVAPRMLLAAFSVVALVQQLHVAARIGLAIVASAIVGRAANRGIPATVSVIRRMLWLRLACKVRAAAVIHPNPAVVKTPGVALLAGLIHFAV